uniref:Uncharacterized protein n=1 Tax=Lepeophtheirus salmonis TaxID=72036 RepID=A0A0K2UG45_LEPSM
MNRLNIDFSVTIRTITRVVKANLGLFLYTRTPPPPSDRGNEGQKYLEFTF